MSDNAGIWINRPLTNKRSSASVRPLNYHVLNSEEEVGHAMFKEMERAAAAKEEDLTIILLGGRGAQALHRLLGTMAKTTAIDALLGRLHVFTQDALAPMRPDNGFSFVRDFERLLGPAFFSKVKSFTPMSTDAQDLEMGLRHYLDVLEARGGIDIFFLGLGPEAAAASHLAYIKPGSGAAIGDIAGIIPISPSILDHHISKFKAGGATCSLDDEAECRAATHILTLGPAAILGARRVVQSIVDADTAPAKRASFRRLIETEFAGDPTEWASQLDANPGLWVRLHANARTLILPNLLQS